MSGCLLLTFEYVNAIRQNVFMRHGKKSEKRIKVRLEESVI